MVRLQPQKDRAVLLVMIEPMSQVPVTCHGPFKFAFLSLHDCWTGCWTGCLSCCWHIGRPSQFLLCQAYLRHRTKEESVRCVCWLESDSDQLCLELASCLTCFLSITAQRAHGLPWLTSRHDNVMRSEWSQLSELLHLSVWRDSVWQDWPTHTLQSRRIQRLNVIMRRWVSKNTYLLLEEIRFHENWNEPVEPEA